MQHVRPRRGRPEARPLGSRARFLIGIALTVLMLASQAQFVAGATSDGSEGNAGSPVAATSEADGADETAPATEVEQPALEESPPAEPVAEEAAPADDGVSGEAASGEAASNSGGADTGGADGADPDTGGGDTGGGEESAGTGAGGRTEKARSLQPPEPDTPGPPSGNGVQPILVEDNPTCGDLAPEGTTWSELKVEPVEDGTFSDGTLTVIVDVRDTDSGQVFDWSSNIGVDAVFAKGGSNGDLYLYDEATFDTSLHAPVNPQNEQFYGLSHISFCYDAEIPEDRFFNRVVKVWLDEDGEPTTPPDLPEGFSITIEGQGDNTGSLTCTIEEGVVECQGDLEIHDPADGVTVTETNPPEGWDIGDVSIECVETPNETGGTDTTCVIRIENVMRQVPEDRFSLEVTKIWLNEAGEEVPPPEDLPEDFAIIIEGQGENEGSLTCSYDPSGEFGCEGDLVVEDGEEVSVSEENAPPGWVGPDSAVAECEETPNETGGTDTACVIEVVNSFRPEHRFSIEVTKLWLDEEGEISETPPDLPPGFELILTGENGSLTCSYEDGTLVCEGDLVVEDGEIVQVSEENAPEGWAAPGQATAECEESENETGGTDTVCTISVTNIAEVVFGQQIIVSKAWLDLEGNLSSTPPEGTPDSFEIVISDGEGSLTCTYQDGDLACTGDLEVEDGERLDIIETDVPENWAGPDHARAQCVTDEETQSTTCIVAIRNIEQEVLGPPPVTPPLAVTGADLGPLGFLALGLVLAGILLVYAGRREDQPER